MRARSRRSASLALAVALGATTLSMLASADDRAPAEAPGSTAADLLDAVDPRVRHLDTAGLRALIEAEPELVVIDVRSPEEIAILGGRIDSDRRNLTIVVPGHGEPTDMVTVTTWTLGYLEYMRAEVGRILGEGGSLIDAYRIDQSAYRHLDAFDELAGMNADRTYRAMEFE